MNINYLIEHDAWKPFVHANTIIEAQGRVVRWSKYTDNVRVQTTAEHITSASFLCHLVLLRLMPYIGNVDITLLSMAKTLHDIGKHTI